VVAEDHQRKESGDNRPAYDRFINYFTNVSNGITSAIELREVTKRFLTPSGQAYTALRDVTLSVAPGEFCAVVVPPACGKSTTLGLISGLERPSQGFGAGHGPARAGH